MNGVSLPWWKGNLSGVLLDSSHVTWVGPVKNENVLYFPCQSTLLLWSLPIWAFILGAATTSAGGCSEALHWGPPRISAGAAAKVLSVLLWEIITNMSSLVSCASLAVWETRWWSFYKREHVKLLLRCVSGLAVCAILYSWRK